MGATETDQNSSSPRHPCGFSNYNESQCDRAPCVNGKQGMDRVRVCNA